MTVLDALWVLKETQVPDLSWRSSCRMGVCGSCAMLINGLPRLACNTQVADLGSSIITVAPLPNFPIIRDLVPALESMFESHSKIMPFIIRDDRQEQQSPTGEYYQSREQLEQFLQFSYCIKCGCCIAACPTCATDERYLGPMALGQAYRYSADSRDGGFEQRREVLAGPGGPWSCHFAGECSRVCPKGVDPAKAIQRLKRTLLLDFFHLRPRQRPAEMAHTPAGLERRPGIPEPPQPTV